MYAILLPLSNNFTATENAHSYNRKKKSSFPTGILNSRNNPEESSDRENNTCIIEKLVGDAVYLKEKNKFPNFSQLIFFMAL